MPAASWPRCCSAWRPSAVSVAASGWPRMPNTPHSSCSVSPSMSSGSVCMSVMSPCVLRGRRAARCGGRSAAVACRAAQRRRCRAASYRSAPSSSVGSGCACWRKSVICFSMSGGSSVDQPVAGLEQRRIALGVLEPWRAAFGGRAGNWRTPRPRCRSARRARRRTRSRACGRAGRRGCRPPSRRSTW